MQRNNANGNDRLLSHELVHVRQWHEMGVLGFLVSYLGDFAKNLLRFKNWNKAYREISLEKEARDVCDAWECEPKTH